MAEEVRKFYRLKGVLEVDRVVLAEEANDVYANGGFEDFGEAIGDIEPVEYLNAELTQKLIDDCRLAFNTEQNSDKDIRKFLRCWFAVHTDLEITNDLMDNILVDLESVYICEDHESD